MILLLLDGCALLRLYMCISVCHWIFSLTEKEVYNKETDGVDLQKINIPNAEYEHG